MITLSNNGQFSESLIEPKTEEDEGDRIAEVLAQVCRILHSFTMKSDDLPEWMETTFENDRARIQVRVELEKLD